MLDTGYWMLDTGCWILDAGCDAGWGYWINEDADELKD